MQVNIVFQTIKDGQIVNDTYTLVTTNDPGREAAGLAGGLAFGALGGFAGGVLGGPYGAFAGDQIAAYYGSKGMEGLYDALHQQYEAMSEEEKAYWREKGYIPFNPNDPQNFDPTRSLDPHLNDLYRASKNWIVPRRDPLVLDLDGDGIETLAINAVSNVVFDYDGDGLKNTTRDYPSCSSRVQRA